jgi:hypothetical protein
LDVHHRDVAGSCRDAAGHSGEFVRRRLAACLAAHRVSAQDLKDRWDDREDAGRAQDRRAVVRRDRLPQAAAELEMLNERVLRQAERAVRALLALLPVWERPLQLRVQLPVSAQPQQDEPRQEQQ